MSLWSQCRLIDIMSSIDMSLVEESIPEKDLNNPELEDDPGFMMIQEKKDNLSLVPEKHNNRKLLPEPGDNRNKKRIAWISGIAAAGSIAITGAVVLACRKHSVFRRAA